MYFDALVEGCYHPCSPLSGVDFGNQYHLPKSSSCSDCAHFFLDLPGCRCLLSLLGLRGGLGRQRLNPPLSSLRCGVSTLILKGSLEWLRSYPLACNQRQGGGRCVRLLRPGSGDPRPFVSHFSGAAIRFLPDLNRSPFWGLCLLPFRLSCPEGPCYQSVNLGRLGFEVFLMVLLATPDCFYLSLVVEVFSFSRQGVFQIVS